jgi:GntR family transcriptional regulator/MocR family aminotransferase
MSRTMTPTVNVGWAVVPRRFAAALSGTSAIPSGPPALTQLALAQFIESGAYDRHLRASRQRFRHRRDALVAALRRELPECGIQGAEAGLHFTLELPAGSNVPAILAAAQRRDMRLCDIADARFEPDPHERLLQVGFGNLSDTMVGQAAHVLAAVVRGRRD